MQFASYDAFFPYYVGQHSKAATRWIHLAGTVGGTAIGLGLVAARRWGGVAVMPAVSYGVAWASHLLIEKNRPATWGHPFWSFRGDMTMIGMMLTGQDHELAAMAREALAAGPPAAAPAAVAA